MTPIHLMLPAWGPGCKRAAEIFFPTLLAPGNLPAMVNPVHIVVYTTRESWGEFSAHPNFLAVARLAELRPIFFDLPPGNESKHITMTRGHELMLAEAEAAHAIAVPVFADTVLADGGLPALVGLARAGRRMVLTLGLRIREEDWLAEHPGNVVAVSPRGLAEAAVRLMHSQFQCWSAENPGYGEDVLGGPWWRAAPDGIAVCSIYWEAALIDFSFPWPHDPVPLREWTIDGHYPWWNLTRPDQFYAVTDSDEFLHATTASEIEYHFEPKPMARDIAAEYRRAREYPATDPLRQELSKLVALVHGSDLTPEWAGALAKAEETIFASDTPTRKRWKLSAAHSHSRSTTFVGDGRDRSVFIYNGQVFSVPKQLRNLSFENNEHLHPGVQTHDSAEDAMRACK